MESIAITLGLFGMLVAGVFVNRFYAEVIYWLCAFAAILRNLQVQAMAEEAQDNAQTPSVPCPLKIAQLV
jgi:hypothetical protein